MTTVMRKVFARRQQVSAIEQLETVKKEAVETLSPRPQQSNTSSTHALCFYRLVTQEVAKHVV